MLDIYIMSYSLLIILFILFLQMGENQNEEIRPADPAFFDTLIPSSPGPETLPSLQQTAQGSRKRSGPHQGPSLICQEAFRQVRSLNFSYLYNMSAYAVCH